MHKTIEQVIELLNDHFADNWATDEEALQSMCTKNKLKFACGETRFCIYDTEWKEVLKIARFDNVESDYNEIEYANYNAACDLEIEAIFLPIRLVDTLDCGLKIYAQQRYDFAFARLPKGKEKRIHRMGDQLQDRHKNPIWYKSLTKCYDCRRIPLAWYRRAYQVYGKQFMRKFERFTQEHEIGDLHSNNCGMIGGKPIILDFAGYFE